MLELAKNLLSNGYDARKVMEILVNGGVDSLEAAQIMVKALEAQSTSKIQMATIAITYNENKNRAGYETDTWVAFNQMLETLVQENGQYGYTKTDFLVTFKDGQEYRGRIDVKEGRTNLGTHMIDYLKNCIAPETAQQFTDKYEIVV